MKSIKPTPSLRPKCYKPQTLKIVAKTKPRGKNVSYSTTHVGTQEVVDQRRQRFSNSNFDKIQSSFVEKNRTTLKS